MATWRVTHSDVPDGWNVHKSGRSIRSEIDTKTEARDLARARASKGDTLIIERMNGTKQKEYEVTSSNEKRLDMNQGNFSIFD